MHLQKNGWIFGSETGGDLFSFLFSLEITLAYGFQKKKVITHLAAENPTISLQIINST